MKVIMIFGQRIISLLKPNEDQIWLVLTKDF